MSVYTVRVEHGRRRPDAKTPEHGPVTPPYLEHPSAVSHVRVSVEPKHDDGRDKSDHEMDQEALHTAYQMAHETGGARGHDMVTKTDIVHLEASLKTAGKHDPWFASASEDEIDGHSSPDLIRSMLGEHVAPNGTKYRLVNHFNSRMVTAHQMPSGRRAGGLTWFGGKKTEGNSLSGTIHKVVVSGPHRRKGLATAMLNFARQQHPKDDILHSTALTDDGKAWADKVARRLRNDLDDWRPHKRIFGPGEKGEDPRLFDGDHLKDEVRDNIIETLDKYWEPKYGHQWVSWAKVYFTGSEASHWYGNNDFDVLIGIDYDEFRKDTGSVLHNERIDDVLNKGFRADMNGTVDFAGDTFDRTWYVNPNSYDIRALKPYAAYDVVDNVWAVRPVEVPKDWGPDKFPASTWRQAEDYANEIQRIASLDPKSRQQYAERLWEHIHTDRQRAFSKRGTGVFDVGNVAEKYLDQRPDHPLALLVEMKNAGVETKKLGYSHEREASVAAAARVEGGKGKPRSVPGSGGDAQRPVQQADRDDQSRRDEASSPVVKWHGETDGDMKKMPKPLRQKVIERADLLAREGRHPSTHSLKGQVDGGWNATHVDFLHRIVHRLEDGGKTLHIGYVGPHDYKKARRRLAMNDADHEAWASEVGSMDGYKPTSWHHEVNEAYHLQRHREDLAEDENEMHDGNGEMRHARENGYQRSKITDFRKHYKQPQEGDDYGRTAALDSANTYTYRHVLAQPRFGKHHYDQEIEPPSSEAVHNEKHRGMSYGAHVFEHQMLHNGVPVAKLRYTIHPDDSGVIDIHGLAVHPDHTRSGLATRLNDRMQDHAEKEGMVIDHGAATDLGHAFRQQYAKTDGYKPHLHLPMTAEHGPPGSGANFRQNLFDDHEIERGRKMAGSAPWLQYYDNADPGWENDDHDNLAENLGVHGVVNHSLGRRLPVLHNIATTAAEAKVVPLSDEEQEKRLAPGTFKEQSNPQAEPSSHVVAGARAYNTERGMSDPHDIDYSKVKTTADNTRRIGRAYNDLPEHDEAAEPHYDAMRKEIGDQYHHMVHKMGITPEFVKEDPYANSKEMMHDVHHNKRIKVLDTASTGSHPYLSDEENNQFRAIHDVFGHAATGRGFDKHGEEAAFQAHSRMFSPMARPAMETETRGQNHFYNLNGKFAQQKVALLPKGVRQHPVPSDSARTAASVYL